MNTHKLHFTLGPVQGFVAQARRTRDLWAGSFLLSYLAGQAMAAVLENGGSIVFPTVHRQLKAKEELKIPEDITDALLKNILNVNKGVVKDANIVTIGSLPNRFVARVPASFNPQQCEVKLREKWRQLADFVWEEFLANYQHLGKDTKEIWERQINNYWEIAWVIGEDPQLLDLRKNWRNYVPSIEYGDKCTLMGDWQELSGYSQAPGCSEAAQQKKFWHVIQENKIGLDLAEGERLCAPAFVKRFYTHVAKKAMGWELPKHYHSTPYMASVDWLAHAIAKDHKAVDEYLRLARGKLGYGALEAPVRYFKPLKKVANTGSCNEQANLANINGNCLHTMGLENENNWPGKHKEILKEINVALKKLQQKIGNGAQPHYVLLIMDGDRMGALLQKYEGQKVSQALQKFTQQVEEVVSQHSGQAIYAGGDDVLAILPFNDALNATVQLEYIYRRTFDELGFKGEATSSAALVYAHYTIPLMAVYKEGNRALDEVAKEETGRHSLAISIWKNSGLQGTWAMPWENFGLQEKGEHLLEKLLKDHNGQFVKHFSTGFLYKLDQYFSLFSRNEADESFTEELLLQMMVAEFLKNKNENLKINQAEIEKKLQLLLRFSTKYKREEGGNIRKLADFSMMGPRLIRFLLQKGGE